LVNAEEPQPFSPTDAELDRLVDSSFAEDLSEPSLGESAESFFASNDAAVSEVDNTLSPTFYDRSEAADTVTADTLPIDENSEATLEAGEQKPKPATEITTEDARRALISTRSFTTNDSYNQLAGRTSFIGSGRSIINFGVSYAYDSNILLSSNTRRVESEVIVKPAVAAVAAQPGINGQPGTPAQVGSPAVTKSVVSYEDQEIEAGSVVTGDLTLGYRGGSLQGPGFYYSLVYGLDVSNYESDVSTTTSFDHALSGDVGVRGGFTEIRFSGSMASNSGQNGFRASQVRREARQAESLNYQAGIDASRKLATGSLELGAAFQLEDFEDSGLGSSTISDRNRWSVDAAWFYDPPFLAYTTLGLGLTYGTEEVSLGNTQQFLTPSIRARWAASPLTSIGAWLGAETRWIDGDSDADASTTPVFGLDASWQATYATSLSLGLTRGVQQSISLLNENVTTTTTSIGLNQRFQHGRSLSLSYRYEFADYGDTNSEAGAVNSNQRDNYHQFSASLNQQLELTGFLNAQLSIFYNYNINASDTPELEFEQSLTGVRMGFSF
jgi:hypothetical protein